MEILVIIVAFWFVLIGVYGALPLFRGRPLWGGSEVATAVTTERRAPIRQSFAPERRIRERANGLAALSQAVAASRAANENAVSVGGLFSEVDLLRAQVEQLRAEVGASAGTGHWGEKPRTRRHGSGAAAYLSSDLRRQVREARSTRRVAPA